MDAPSPQLVAMHNKAARNGLSLELHGRPVEETFWKSGPYVLAYGNGLRAGGDGLSLDLVDETIDMIVRDDAAEARR